MTLTKMERVLTHHFTEMVWIVMTKMLQLLPMHPKYGMMASIKIAMVEMIMIKMAMVKCQSIILVLIAMTRMLRLELLLRRSSMMDTIRIVMG